ncbi:DUF3040 domain-containing protein [Streptomyces coeruleoprunus]|uniref:DUF3040 domain-containing protein n=1 Tax=Streptomyces coeruleoprunus TaxID=285563 RepID=A0ABV9X811_9ACTN
MAPGMDEDRLLAEIERLLAREDPALDERMTALGRQFTEGDAAPGPARPARRERTGRRNWRKVVAIAAVVIGLLGILLTAILSRPADSGFEQPPPAGMPPAVTLRI